MSPKQFAQALAHWVRRHTGRRLPWAAKQPKTRPTALSAEDRLAQKHRRKDERRRAHRERKTLHALDAAREHADAALSALRAARKEQRREDRLRARMEKQVSRAHAAELRAVDQARARAAEEDAARRKAWREELLNSTGTVVSLYLRLDAHLRAGRLAEAVDQIGAFTRASGVRRLTAVSEFISFVDAELPVWPGPPESDRRAVLHFAVWGRTHRERFVCFCVPSLLAPHNVPRLSQTRSVVVLIHTDDATHAWLAEQPAIRLLESHARVVFETFREQDITTLDLETTASRFFQDWKYFMLGGLQRRAIAFASASDSHLALLFSDNCFADGALTRWFELADSGYHVVTTQVPRTQLEAARPGLETCRNGSTLSIPADQLVALQIAHLHDSNVERMVFDGNDCFTGAAQILFHTTHGFAIRGFHYHPIVSSPAALRVALERHRGMVPADEYILGAALDSGTTTSVFLPATGTDCAVMELSGVEMACDRSAAGARATIEEQAARFASGPMRGGSESQWALMEHRVHYARPGSPPLQDEEDTEIRFMRALQASRAALNPIR